jgi:hypothetical protein
MQTTLPHGLLMVQVRHVPTLHSTWLPGIISRYNSTSVHEVPDGGRVVHGGSALCLQHIEPSV